MSRARDYQRALSVVDDAEMVDLLCAIGAAAREAVARSHGTEIAAAAHCVADIADAAASAGMGLGDPASQSSAARLVLALGQWADAEDAEADSSRRRRASSGEPMRVLLKKEVIARVGYSGMHLSRLEKAGKFPKRLQLGPNRVAWLSSEIEDWLAAKAQDR